MSSAAILRVLARCLCGLGIGSLTIDAFRLALQGHWHDSQVQYGLVAFTALIWATVETIESFGTPAKPADPFDDLDDSRFS